MVVIWMMVSLKQSQVRMIYDMCLEAMRVEKSILLGPAIEQLADKMKRYGSGTPIFPTVKKGKKAAKKTTKRTRRSRAIVIPS